MGKKGIKSIWICVLKNFVDKENFKLNLKGVLRINLYPFRNEDIDIWDIDVQLIFN